MRVVVDGHLDPVRPFLLLLNDLLLPHALRVLQLDVVI